MDFTLIRRRKSAVSCTRLDSDKFLITLRNGTYSADVNTLRSLYPAMQIHRRMGRREETDLIDRLPKVCFSACFTGSQRTPHFVAYNSMVMLQIHNMANESGAAELRDAARHIPYTMLAFVGATGRDVVVVCKVEAMQPCFTDEQRLRMMTVATQRLHYIYSTQLGVSFDKGAVSLTDACPVSADADAYCNLQSETYHVSTSDSPLPGGRNLFHTDNDTEAPQLEVSPYVVYEWCLDDALKKSHQKAQSAETKVRMAVSLLARYCRESGIDIDFARRCTGWKSHFDGIEQSYIDMVFQNEYEKELSHAIPFAHIDRNALLTYRTEAFFNMHYRLRRNVMSGVVQYSRRNGFDAYYQDLTDEVMNSMTIRALKAGMSSWDKDVRRIVHSNDVPLYDPVEDYFAGLPEWDGKDRVSRLLCCLPIDEQSCRYGMTAAVLRQFLHVWLRSVVAHWMGKNLSHGNALVPMLIGSQGCGKTTFFNRLLPAELHDYYHDKVEFKSDTDLMLGLCSFALINIDEFDSLKRSQQPILKYLLSKTDVKMRLPYGKTITRRRRYASFCATTNSLHPLTDPTGSRRFICIRIAEGEIVDNVTAIDYQQFYAQLLAEVNDGERFWLNDGENALLVRYNAQFQRVTSLDSLIDAVVAPSSDPDHLMPVSEIGALISASFPYIPQTRGLYSDIGKALQNRGFSPKHTKNGQFYALKKR